jgi:hypothetical protein
MRAALFRDITQRIMVLPNGRFGTTYWSFYFEGQGIKDGTESLSQHVCNQLLLYAD